MAAPHVLTKQDVEVATQGELVRFTIGDESRLMEYPTALKLAAWLRLEAKVAKLFAHDHFKRWSVHGNLEDASAEKVARFNRRSVRQLNLVKNQQLTCRTEGQLVVVKLADLTLKMPYQTALKISTWLRMRGKQAQRAAGDFTHWSVVGQVAAIQAGDRPYGNY